ncbi:hypothetical protein B0T14DRAFT_561131 [Immersiella caudata]|uniref:Uncharacterized protein n=1 Tax=Immersiella caudata TaxID=314043 RepID=A0AA39XGF2_9PEZI|nr:hypothetical protein B0T14DRAFT_561131 [Immersiella caudata]
MAPTTATATGPNRQSLIYKFIMTPIIFISFIVSLSLIDMRHSAQRSHYHADSHESRMPAWLHRIIYRYQRYQYVPVDENGKLVGKRVGDGKEYYHSHQRKLMRMEVAEAFEIRSSVVVALGLVSMGVLWGVWRLFTWGMGLAGFPRP